MTSIPMIPAKRMLRPLNAFTGLIKGQAALEPANGLVPGYSASGQDVWVPQEIARGHGAGIVLSAVGARCGKTFLTTAPQWGTVANTIAWSVSPAWDPKFVHYVLNREDFWVKGGSAQPYVQVEPSLVQSVANLSRNRQAEIVAFLDNETAQMDDLIRKQERLIELLVEKRQSVITQAVTKGLDPNAPTKPSGIPWVGDIPAHWVEKPMNHFMTGRVDYRGATPQKTDHGVFLVTAKNVRKGHIDYSASAEYISTDDYKNVMSRGLPAVGDILMTMEAPLGNFALIDDPNIALAQRVIKFRPKSDLISEFAIYATNSPYFQAQLAARATGSTALGLKASKLSELRLVAPSSVEQEGIIKILNSVTERIDTLVQRAGSVVKLLRERRSALISAAVTGKIDVREGAA